MREVRKLAVFLLMLAMIVSGIHCTVADAAANNTTQPASGSVSKPVAGPTGSVNGTVFDAIGNLVPDADVYLHDGRGVAMGLTVTDGNGTYSYTELDPGNYSIVVQVDGYAWYKKLAVAAGAGNASDIHIPDYVHYPMVTPWPALNSINNSTSAGATKVVTATPAPTPKPVQTNVTVNHTAPDDMGTINEEEESTGSPIDDFINGIVSFFKSILGMSE
ncbi:carboxypeptidase-like regulatory domain-containing protein [Methanocella sp. MCL-LM]|uniref:carboxypeptidase-like regulatory domain-containing protein n=1 Tax=Methanocella sp. MCL-LM TaxID=3412035 RepID=UPI003C78F054